jgi:hypothetical protein
MRHMKHGLLIAAAAAALPGLVKAAPLVNLQIMGSSDQGKTYSSTMQVVAGQTYDFEVIGQLAPVGTTNGSTTITQEVAGSDGIGSLSFNLIDSGANGLQISFGSDAAVVGTFAAGTGARPGTLASTNGGTNNELSANRPVNPNGTFNAINGSPLVVETGSFTANSGANGASSSLIGTFAGALSGIKINGGASKPITSGTESGADPMESIAPLDLTTAGSSVPEPASMAVFGVGMLGLLARRRRQA